MNDYITGLAGFLGSHLADRLLDEGHFVDGCDSLIGGDFDNVPFGKRAWLTEAACEAIDAYDLRHTDVLYHCAALAHEGLSVFSPALISQNIYGADCYPVDPYGVSKLAAERLLAVLAEAHGFEYVIAVPHNIIGPRQKYDDPYRNVASIMVNRMLQGQPPIIYGDGNQKRCFSFVQDCVESLARMATYPVSAEVINIGPDEGMITINELARILMDLTGFKGDPVYMPGRPQEVKEAWCSSDKARRLLGFDAKTPLVDGLRSIVEHIRERGPKPFNYHLPVEIVKGAPKTWTERII
jgi:UDP-glucose 4-epimerase